MYEYEDEEEGGRSNGRTIGAVVGIIVLALVGWFFVKPRLSGGDDGGTVAPGGTGATATSVAETDGAAAGDEPAVSSVDSAADETATTAEATATTVASDTPTTKAPAPTSSTSATTTPTSTAPPTTSTGPYATIPNGDPVPVLAIYDTDKVTLRGVVPDQAAADRLGTLALANGRPEQQNLVNELTTNPAVPLSVGVRVLELTSARFPEGSSEILPEHAAELDRVANVMVALPNITVEIIGHADQRGNELTNYVISEDRAQAVFNYLAGRGVAPSRLSSRAVGESDLLTINDDDAALALNRRTEFIFKGLLLP